MRTPRRLAESERQLAVAGLALVLTMAPWFSTAAVIADLRVRLDLGAIAASWLTIGVQLGFVLGAVASAVTGWADRLAAGRLMLVGAVAAAVANAAVIVAPDVATTLLARVLTGAALATVYPAGLRAASGWFRQGRGRALGWMVGGLTLGSALPHLVAGVGGLDWRVTIAVTSALTLLGGIVADRGLVEGPYQARPTRFAVRQIRAVLRRREFRFATLGYLGHMWELYAMWAWIGVFYAERWPGRSASLAAFGTIAAGALGAVYAGRLSDRLGRVRAASESLRWSGSAALVVGFLLDAPWPILLGVGATWGFWVVADSAQFSVIVSEHADPRTVGTALTLQLGSGFVLSVVTIFLIPVIVASHGWGWAFVFLVPGPLIGVWAMRRVRPARPAMAFASPYV